MHHFAWDNQEMSVASEDPTNLTASHGNGPEWQSMLKKCWISRVCKPGDRKLTFISNYLQCCLLNVVGYLTAMSTFPLVSTNASLSAMLVGDTNLVAQLWLWLIAWKIRYNSGPEPSCCHDHLSEVRFAALWWNTSLQSLRRILLLDQSTGSRRQENTIVSHGDVFFFWEKWQCCNAWTFFFMAQTSSTGTSPEISAEMTSSSDRD